MPEVKEIGNNHHRYYCDCGHIIDLYTDKNVNKLVRAIKCSKCKIKGKVKKSTTTP